MSETDPKPEDAGRSQPSGKAKSWVAGEQPITSAQASYLRTLCEEAGEPFDPDLTKAEASIRIDRLRRAVGRGD